MLLHCLTHYGIALTKKNMNNNSDDLDDEEGKSSQSPIGRGTNSYGRSSQSPVAPAQAYAMPPFSFTGRSKTDIIAILCIGFFFLFFLRNLIFKDYTEETKSYLTAIGKKDAIDRVIPKTRAQVMEEKVRRLL